MLPAMVLPPFRSPSTTGEFSCHLHLLLAEANLCKELAGKLIFLSFGG
jgi:hypothetical protein